MSEKPYVAPHRPLQAPYSQCSVCGDTLHYDDPTLQYSEEHGDERESWMFHERCVTDRKTKPVLRPDAVSRKYPKKIVKIERPAT